MSASDHVSGPVNGSTDLESGADVPAGHEGPPRFSFNELMLKRHIALAALPLLASCVIEKGARPQIDADLQVVSADVHRGMVQTEHGALIPGTVSASRHFR